MDIPTTVHSLFVAAGWQPGRRVAVAAEVPVAHPAAEILAEFGGLRVGVSGAGQECASSDVAFGRSWGAELSDIELWSELLDSPLACIAEIHNAHGELYVDGLGRHFGMSMVHDAFWFEGQSFGEAMERLLLGRRSQPMLRPGQDTMMWYGETITADDPRIYRYR